MIFKSIFKVKKVYFVMLLLALWFGCAPSTSFSLPIGSYEHRNNYTADREAIDSFLAQDLVSERLAKMGLSEQEVRSRLDKLSNEQIHELASNLERIKAGSGSAWAIALVAVLFFVGLVLFFITHTVHVEPKEPDIK